MIATRATAVPPHPGVRLLAALGLAVAILLAGLPVAPTVVPVARAATPDLTVIADATYEIQPDQRRVAVTADMTLVNRLRDTATLRYYFDQAFIVVLPKTSGFAVSSSTRGLSPTVRVREATEEQTTLDVRFGGRLFSGQTARFRLTFQLVDEGGSIDRNVRIGPNLATFQAWGISTPETNGGSVRIVFDDGYTFNAVGSEIGRPRRLDDDRMVAESGPLTDAWEYAVVVTAANTGDTLESVVNVDFGGRTGRIRVVGFADDPAWAERVVDLYGRAAPVLDDAIGIPWQIDDPLRVRQGALLQGGDLAGLFTPSPPRIDLAYGSGDVIALHELAHAWFHGGLLAERWALEGFATYYADRAAEEIEADLTGGSQIASLTPEVEAARIPLNDWAAVASDETDEFGYAGSYELARGIAAIAGDEVLKAVWQDAMDRVAPYQSPETGMAPGRPLFRPPGHETPEDADSLRGAPDWRVLLDLLEERSGKSFEGLWREWVIRPSDTLLFGPRAEAREQYVDVVEAADGWRLPASIRSNLRAWQFRTAITELGEVTAVLERRDEHRSAIEAAGLETPPTVREAFEAEELDRALAEMDAEAAVLEVVVDAQAARIAEPDPFEMLGLLGVEPDVQLAAAERAFGIGDLAVAEREANAAQAAWDEATEVGQQRALIGFGAFVLLLLVLLIVAWQVRRRRRRRRFALAEASMAVEPTEASMAVEPTEASTAVEPTEASMAVEPPEEPPG